ncbi:M48 family metallopeptidase [Aurantiacibacter poecillastricola]|uniref:M48 family metallopeptidase n=1 Tax=Aurantiacibacter poecillastricola TaxID=3064385 RepID=UPI00273D788D|nr:M48 family metallopeptidase [Aurantiacibacter sp. 219JJ12-13]MDP5261033.1 M48 family metallopeptidase [Aurantiacibacter sp. 219JJ12-13]
MATARIEAETQALMSALSPEELALARDYTTGNHWLILAGLLVSALVTWIIVRSGVLDRLSARLQKRRPSVRAFLIAAVFMLVDTLLTLPYAIYSGWWRESAYGRTSQPLADYLMQGGISLVLAMLLGGLLLAGIYSLMRRTGRWWWAWSGALVAGGMAFFLLLSPVLIEPLFNQYEPIPEGEVRDAVVTLAVDAGVPEDRVFMYDGSRQSNNFTANVSGVGGNARIAISDVAMDEASLDEVIAVTGHEVGHYVLGHVWRSIAVLSVLAVLIFFLTDRLYPAFARLFGTDAPLADPRGLPVFLFTASLLLTLAQPIINTMTRIGEREADAYSLEHARLPDALAAALVKTSEYRYPYAGPLEEAIFYTHPTVENRVRSAMAWKVANMTAEPAP